MKVNRSYLLTISKNSASQLYHKAIDWIFLFLCFLVGTGALVPALALSYILNLKNIAVFKQCLYNVKQMVNSYHFYIKSQDW
jgi:hypothetical protein